jgi:hypothetical protein
MKVMSPTKPTTSGARICADDQGKLMPPKVKATVIEHAAAMTMKFPLKINSEISFITTLNGDFSYIQSIRESLSRQVPAGVGRLRSMTAKPPDKPHNGRLRSAASSVLEKSAW